MRLGDLDALWCDIQMLPHNGDMISSEEVEQAITDAPTIDVVPRPSYKVPTKEEWQERYCTNKQLAGIRHREQKENNT